LQVNVSKVALLAVVFRIMVNSYIESLER